MLHISAKSRDFSRYPTGSTPNCPVKSVNSGISGATILRHGSQSSSRQVQIGQRTQHKQRMCILIQPTVANLCISEGTLEDGKDMFHFRSDLDLVRLRSFAAWSSGLLRRPFS